MSATHPQIRKAAEEFRRAFGQNGPDTVSLFENNFQDFLVKAEAYDTISRNLRALLPELKKWKAEAWNRQDPLYAELLSLVETIDGPQPPESERPPLPRNREVQPRESETYPPRQNGFYGGIVSKSVTIP
jgi:hypothetical protein